MWRRKNKEWRPWFSEIWVLFLFFVLILCLTLGGPWNLIILCCSIYILIDAFGAAVRDIVASPVYHHDCQGSYTKVYDKTRWLILAVANIFQVILCFGVLSRYYGYQFQPQILDPWSAVYFSIVTFLTLGYGDIVPTCVQTRVLVIIEMVLFLAFLIIKLPIAISVMRVKEEKTFR
jgi:hypothetical protein